MISPSVSSSSSTTRIESSADWEKEKRMLARKTHDYTRRMEDIVLQKDKKISQYENDIQSLLRKNKTTDKRISDVKTEYETIVHYYINTLREKELEYRKKEEEWKQIYDQLVTKEQAKSERRLNEFRERMMAKDIEYARLEAVRQTQSAPTSPVHATFKQYPNQELKKEIEELKLSHQVEIERLKADYEERLVQQDELLSQRNPSFYKKLKQFEVWKERMVAETEKDKALSQKKITDLEMKVKDLKDKMFSHDESMKQLYMKENQQLTMQYEAKIDNLETEHHHTLQEAQDSFENEKDVLRIELQLSRDQEKKEMEDRLGKEQLRYSQLKRSHVRISDQMHQLQKQENTAKQLAKSIVSITSSSPMNSSLLDLLTRALHDIAGIKMKNSVIEQSMETSFNMGYTPFGY
ncbi:hypothetical protein BDB01DRAFT_107971 [Pilobolus umbonatus]|nr:hypothetical protein BDB01DRAFT_107971 [Pilobolus umbonatus]